MSFLDFLFKKQPVAEKTASPEEAAGLAEQEKKRAAAAAVPEFERLESDVLKESTAAKAKIAEMSGREFHSATEQPNIDEIARSMRDNYAARVGNALETLSTPAEGDYAGHAAFAAALRKALEEIAKTTIDNRYVFAFYRKDIEAVAANMTRLGALSDELTGRAAETDRRLSELDAVIYGARGLAEAETAKAKAEAEAAEAKGKAEAAARATAALKEKFEASTGLRRAAAEANEFKRAAGVEREKLADALQPLQRSFRKLARFGADEATKKNAEAFASDPVNAFLAEGGSERLASLLQSLRTMPGEESAARSVDYDYLAQTKDAHAELSAQAMEKDKDALPLAALENEMQAAKRDEEEEVREANAAADAAEKAGQRAAEKRFELAGKASSALGVKLANA